MPLDLERFLPRSNFLTKSYNHHVNKPIDTTREAGLHHPI